MRSRLLLGVACVVLVTAASCSGHPTKVSAANKVSPTNAAAPRSKTAPTAPPGVPKVMLQSGTSYQNGALVQFCEGSSCRQGTGRQTHALVAADPLLFLIDQIPLTARVQITRAGATAPSDTRALHVGSLMAYAPTVRPGAYQVRLDATWKDGTGTWVFAVAIPIA